MHRKQAQSVQHIRNSQERHINADCKSAGLLGAHPDTAAMENLVFTPVGSKRLVIKGITCLAALAGFALAAVSRCAHLLAYADEGSNPSPTTTQP